MQKVKVLLSVAFALCVIGAPAVASADVSRSGHTFTASPAACSCWSTIDGYEFRGIPYSPFIVSWLGLPADTVTAVDIWSALQSDPNYVPLPPVTSGSVEVEVGGTVGDGGDDPPDEEPEQERSSWG